MLKEFRYETPDQIDALGKNKSYIEDQLFANDAENRSLKKEIQSCNSSLELNKHIEEKMNRLEEMDKHDGEKKHTTKEIVLNLSER